VHDDAVNQQYMQQHRDVAHVLNIDVGELVGQPVLRQSDNTEDETDNGCQNDTSSGNQQCVDDTDHHGSEMR